MEFAELSPSPIRILQRAVCLVNSTLAMRCRALTNIRRSQAEFDIDPITGFHPRSPLPKLPQEYAVWEDALCSAQEFLKLGEDDSPEALSLRAEGEVWRSVIRSSPVLSIERLKTDYRLLQRAHQVLVFLIHFYVHSMPPTKLPEDKRVPESLAVPVVEVSRILGIAPVLTYSDTVLWNWELIRPNDPVTMDNLKVRQSFTGSDDESHFYLTSAYVDLHGAQILRIIDEYNRLPDLDNFASTSKVARDLARLTGIIGEISDLIQSVRAGCDPHYFYWNIRPWFEGSDAKGPSEPGWIYEGVDASYCQDLSGPSGGQSPIMHALDLFLDIDHKLRQKRSPAPSAENKRADHGFMERMRRYMPGKHREYLEYLGNTPCSVRELAQRTPILREPYNNAVAAMKRLRDLHMRIACLYIVNMARSNPGTRSGCPASAMLERLQESRAAGKGPVRGTGGNELSLLLKAGRDATARAALKN